MPVTAMCWNKKNRDLLAVGSSQPVTVSAVSVQSVSAEYMLTRLFVKGPLCYVLLSLVRHETCVGICLL